MIRARIYEPIASEENRWFYEWMGSSGVFSLAAVNALLDEHPEEKDLYFDIHCAGGEVEEGLAIYDKLRTSGRNIHMNIEGGCHSMAVTLLLAAPLEWRTANANAIAMIHKVSGYAEGTSADLTAAANSTAMLEQRIIEIYAERTGHSVEEMQALMDKQEEHNAHELLNLGFIGKINPYNTNYKTFKNMAKNNKVVEFLNSVQKFLSGSKNYEFVDADGNVLFSTEGEDDTLEVGMAAAPDGEFTIADGRTIVIADGVITEIREAEGGGEGEGEGEGSENAADLEAANARIAELEARVAELEAENSRIATESVNIIRDLRSQIRSNFTPAPRNGGPAADKKPSGKADKAAVKAALDAVRGKNGEGNK